MFENILENIEKKYLIIGGVVAIAVFILIGYMFGTARTSEDVIGRLTANIQGQIDTQYKDRLESLQKTLDSKNKQLQEQEKKYIAIMAKLGKLAEEKANVKPPQTDEDRTARLNALGLKPVVR